MVQKLLKANFSIILFLGLLMIAASIFSIPSVYGASSLPEALTLSHAIQLALKKNLDLSALQMDEKATRAAIRKSRGRLYPRLDAYSSYKRMNNPSAVIPVKGPSPSDMPYFSRDLYAAGLHVSLPLYEGGLTRTDIHIASLSNKAAKAAVVRKRQILVSTVTDTFNYILYLKRLRKAQSETLQALKKARADAFLRLKLGKIPPLDLMEMDTQVASQEQALVSTHQSIKKAKQYLAVLMGLDPSSEPEVLGTLLRPQSKVFSQALIEQLIKNRPDILEAQRQVEKAEASVRRASSKKLPRIELFGDWGLRAGSRLQGEEGIWSAGINLSFNIYDGKRTSSEVAEARFRLNATKKRLRALRLQAKSQVLSALSSLKDAEARLLVSKKVQQSAKEAFRIEKLRYDKGAGTVTDLLKAQAAWQQAKAQYIKALYDINSAVTALKLATGTILPPLNRES